MRIFLTLISLFWVFPAYAQSIVWLSSPGMDTNDVIAVSNDGSLAGGRYWYASGYTTYLPFIWTPDLGMVSLTRPGFAVNEGIVCYVDPEGRFALGYADSSDGKYYVFKWTRDSGAVVIPEIPPNSFSCSAAGDSIIVGGTVIDPTSGYAWRMINGVMTDTLYIPGSFASANVVSGNGMVVGVDVWNDTADLDYRWVPDSGTLTPLTQLGGNFNIVSDVSYDGSALVGRSEDSTGSMRAVLWHADGSVMDLGTLGGDEAIANSISDSGDMVVGMSALPTYSGKMRAKPKPDRFYRPSFKLPVGFGYAAFVWTPDSGMRDLNEVYSSVLGSSVLIEAYGMSPNGRFIVGYGYNSATGYFQGFILDRFGLAVEEQKETDPVSLIVRGREIESRSDVRIYDPSGRLVGEIRGSGAWKGKPGVYFVRWRGGSRVIVLR